jgi:hypothetical protein
MGGCNGRSKKTPHHSVGYAHGSAVTRHRCTTPSASRYGRASRAERAGSHCATVSRAAEASDRYRTPKLFAGGSPLQQLGGAAFHRIGFTDHHQHADRVYQPVGSAPADPRLVHRYETRRPAAPTSHPESASIRASPVELHTSTVLAATLARAIWFMYPRRFL